MAPKNKDRKTKSASENNFNSIKNETKQGIFAIAFLVLSIIFILASIKTGSTGNEVYYAGPVGREAYRLLSILLGVGYFLIPLFFLLLSISFFKKEERDFNGIKIFGGVLFFAASALSTGAAVVIGFVSCFVSSGFFESGITVVVDAGIFDSPLAANADWPPFTLR